MAFIDDPALDLILDEIVADADRLVLCSAEPTTYGEATTIGAVMLGAVTISGPDFTKQDSAVGVGREIVVAAKTIVSADAGGAITHYAIVDDTAQRIWVQSASASGAAVVGETINIASFVVRQIYT